MFFEWFCAFEPFYSYFGAEMVVLQGFENGDDDDDVDYARKPALIGPR
jgi:hypothetical protein